MRSTGKSHFNVSSTSCNILRSTQPAQLTFLARSRGFQRGKMPFIKEPSPLPPPAPQIDARIAPPITTGYRGDWYDGDNAGMAQWTTIVITRFEDIPLLKQCPHLQKDGECRIPEEGVDRDACGLTGGSCYVVCYEAEGSLETDPDKQVASKWIQLSKMVDEVDVGHGRQLFLVHPG